MKPAISKSRTPPQQNWKPGTRKAGSLLKSFLTQVEIFTQNLKDRLPEMTEAEQLELLATDGMLVKRPIVVGEDFVLVGFKDVEFEDKLK